MVNTRNNPAVQAQGEANAARAENLPQPPSLAEVMLEAERNKRETNRLLARIKENTAPQCKESATIYDFIGLKPPTFHHSIEPLDADDWLRSITIKLCCISPGRSC